jgi:3-hydroxy-9,10-secoandrosta-1,3,5(10)-triene-9,17-dione monooxygenase
MDGAEYGPARTIHRRASYGVPNEVSIIHCTISPFIGAARGALDTLSEQMASTRNSLSQASKAESVNIQLRIGEAAAEIDAALSLARVDLRDLLELGAREKVEVMTPEQRATYRLHQCYNLLLARRAATRLYEVSGSAGLFDTSPLARIFNDIYAISKHIFHTWDEHAENYGRVRLGLDPNALQG